MGRILALDYGSKRIGLAVSDLEHIIAQIKEPPLSKENYSKELKRIVVKYQIESILLGLPKNLKGQYGPATVQVKVFKDKIEQLLKLPVRLVDERFSTKRAFQILSKQNLARQKRKNLIDNYSAQLLLQEYLDRKQK